MLGPDLGLPLSVLGIEKMDGVAVGDEQFARVLYRQQAFLAGDELNQCLGKRRLAGTRRAGDQDILARQIGSASRRARVCLYVSISGGAGSLKQKYTQV